MKILFLSFYYHPDLCAGSFRSSALVAQLKRKVPEGAKIDVVTTMPNRYQSFDVGHEVYAFEKDGNINIHRIALPTHKSGMLDQIKAFTRYFVETKKIVENSEYDIIFATSSRLFTAFLGANIAKSKKKPLYLDIRDIFVDTLSDVLNQNISSLLLPLLKHVENYTFKTATAINLVSEGFSEYFTIRFKTQYYYFSNGIDNEFCGLDIPPATVTNVKTILYAGNLGEGQGLHKIVPNLAKRTEDKFKFVVVGDGGRAQQLKQALEKANVTNVEFLAPVDRQQLIEHYKRADVLFMHLNDYQAFEKVLPSKVFEYAALNKPILAGVTGYAAKFVRANVVNAQVFNPCDVKGALDAIEQLSFDTTDRADFIRNYKRENIMSQMADSIIIMAENTK